MFARTLAFYILVATCTPAQVLWREPPPLSAADWTWGPGGKETAPQPPFRFVKEKFGGTNPKVEVKDERGRRWTVKFGSEAHTDTFQSRFVSSLGYAAEPVYFVKAGTILDVHDLKRAKHFVAKNGSFHDARFKLEDHASEADTTDGAWSWAVNPFIGTRELGGLKILAMLTSNWDTKDSRNGAGSNTGVIPAASGISSTPRYAVVDWGASLGRTGSLFKRNRWDWEGYRLETRNFVRLGSDGRLRWRYKGRHGDDITAGVGIEDVRWILRYLSRISDEDLKTGLAASGASEPVAREYARLIRQRIVQMQNVAQSQGVQRAAK
jgi:hypothetical protein